MVCLTQELADGHHSVGTRWGDLLNVYFSVNRIMLLCHDQYAGKCILLGLRPPQLRCPATPDSSDRLTRYRYRDPIFVAGAHRTVTARLSTLGMLTIFIGFRLTQGALTSVLGRLVLLWMYPQPQPDTFCIQPTCPVSDSTEHTLFDTVKPCL